MARVEARVGVRAEARGLSEEAGRGSRGKGRGARGGARVAGRGADKGEGRGLLPHPLSRVRTEESHAMLSLSSCTSTSGPCSRLYRYADISTDTDTYSYIESK